MRHRILHLTVVCLLIGREVGAQNKPNAALADSARRLLRLGDTAFTKRLAPHPDSALSLWRQAATLAHDARHRGIEGEAVGNLGIGANMRGQRDSALVYYRRGLELLGGTGNVEGEVDMLANVAGIFFSVDKVDSAVVYHRRALSLLRDTDRRKILELVATAPVLDRFGMPDSASAYERRAVAIARSLHDTLSEARALFASGNRALTHGRPDSGAAAFSAAYALIRTRDPVLARGYAGSLAYANILWHQDDSATTIRRTLDSVYRACNCPRDEAGYHVLVSRGFQVAGRGDSAIAEARLAIDAARRAKLGDAEAASLLAMDRSFTAASQYDSALVYARQAVAVSRARSPANLRTALNDAARALANTGFLDSAADYHREVLRQARNSGDVSMEGVSLNGLGNVALRAGKVDSALAYSRAGIDLARRARFPGMMADALLLRGRSYDAAANLDSALASFHGAQNEFHQIGNIRGEAGSLNSIGDLFVRFYRFDSAMVAWRESLRLYRSAGDIPSVAWEMNRVGTAFLMRLNADSALWYMHAALRLYESTGSVSGQANTLRDIAGVYRWRRMADSTLAYAARSLGLGRRIGSRLEEAWSLLMEAPAFDLLHQYDSARVALDTALVRVRAFHNRAGERDVHLALAEHYAHASEPRDFVKAFAYYDSSAAITRVLRLTISDDLNRTGFTEAYSGIYLSWVRALITYGVRTRDTRAWAAAIAVDDASRAQGLADHLRMHTRAPRGTIAELAAQGDSILAPFRRRHAAAIIAVNGNDTTYVFTLKPSGALSLRAWAADSAGRLGRLMDQARTEIGIDYSPILRHASSDASAPIDAKSSAVSQLARIFLADDIASWLPRSAELTLIPQGTVASIPFGALGVPGTREPLGVRNALRYGPSLSIITALETRARAASERVVAEGSALIVANPTLPSWASVAGTRAEFRPLPAAEAEGSMVAQAFHAPMLSGGAATETAVRSRMKQAHVLHFATHGYSFTDDERAAQSFVAFARDSVNDGLLTAGEILSDPAITLQAELVVLSACSSGLGSMRAIEGTVGLQRAFLAKGARSVLASLWDVDDRATQLLMERFYAHWADDPAHPSKAEALRLAQRDVRARPEFAEPRYWAGFQLIGAR